MIWLFFSEKGNVESEVITGGRYQIQPHREELLIITTEPSDSALFSCNATNSHGSISAEAYLNVYRELLNILSLDIVPRYDWRLAPTLAEILLSMH